MSAASDRQTLIKLFQRYNQRLGILYGKFVKELSKLGVSVEDKLQDKPLFLFDHFPELKTRLSEIIKEYKADYVNLYKQGISSGVALAFGQDAKNLHGYTIYNDDAIERVRTAAVNAFTKQRMSPAFGLGLSQKIWNYLQQTKSEFEVAVSNVITDGLKKGTSAAELSRQVRQQLVNPDMMYRRYHHKVITAGGTKKDVVKWHKRIIDGRGKMRFVEAPLEEVGRGVYRSSYKNSFRLMRTEINMSYHYANNERWKAEPFVIGMRISLSPEHPREDMCDELAGDYPKDFNWASWHPQCYSDDSEVYTSRGWLLFKDVRIEDKVLSLNPYTKNVEWTDIVRLIAYQKEGKMVRFYNRSLDMLVTPDHRMVYLSKSIGEIQYKEADKFGCTNILYRSCVYDNNHHDSIEINNTQFDFKTFCEFMGYWLSDGNVSRSTTIFIAQQKGDPNRANIISCIERLGLTPRPAKNGIYTYSRPLRDYLAQFGKSYEKFVPQEIKDASKKEIRRFLDAYVSCDGNTRTPHSFIGSHGNVCNPKHEEKIYYTTSKRMADDIGECILKVGCRPSFFLDEHKGQKHQFRNGEYTINFDCWRISELISQTATQFKKEYVDYDGIVYDLELAENHIMYIRRNGKCVWGSNCLCMSSAILCSKEELKEIAKRTAKGEDMSQYKSPNLITECPENFNRYIDSQHDKIIAAAERGTLGYYLRDNKKYWAGRFSASERQQMGISDVSSTNRVKEVAKMRHAKRTPEQIADIQNRWEQREEKHALIKKTADNVLKVAQDYGEVDYAKLQQYISEGNLSAMQTEAKAVAHSVSAMKKQEAALSSLIPDAHGLHKQYSMAELQQAYKELDDVMNRWLKKYSYSSIDTAPLEHLKNKLDFELTSSNNSYSQKEIVKKALMQKMQIVEQKIAWNDMLSKATSLRSFQTKSAIYKDYLTKIDAAIQSKDFNALQKAIDDAEQQQQKLIAQKIKRSGNTKSALNKEYKGSADGRDITSSIDVNTMVSEDPYNSSSFTNNVARMQGFDAPAKLVSEQEFDMLEKSCGEVFYRTVNPTTFKGKKMSSKEFASQLYISDKLELNGPGGRVYGDGMYVATAGWDGDKLCSLTKTTKQDAYRESRRYGGRDATIYEMTFTRKPKIITQKELRKKWRSLSSKVQAAFGDNENTYGCALGYDAMYCDGPNYMVIWNRSIIAIKKQ